MMGKHSETQANIIINLITKERDTERFLLTGQVSRRLQLNTCLVISYAYPNLTQLVFVIKSVRMLRGN